MVLVLLPGVWIRIELHLTGLSSKTRILLGIVISPLVLVVQFYLIRSMGVPFELTATRLVFLNLPVLYLIARGENRNYLPSIRKLTPYILVLLTAIATLAPKLLNEDVRLFTSHAWMHTNIIYALTNGTLPALSVVVMF